MHVVVLGAGYAGLVLARRLERSLPDAVRLTVVDERDHHLLQHELHRVVRDPSLASALRIPLADVLDCEVRQARVADVDLAAGVAHLDDDVLDYDYGAVCLGAAPDFHGLPGVEVNATPLKRLEHAERIRARFFANRGGRVVVGGGGLSGVQAAGELAATADEQGFDTEVVLLERRASVAPDFPDAFQEAVHEELTAQGVRVRTGTPIAGADEAGVNLASGEREPCDQFVWTGGIRGPDALGGDRPVTRADLRSENGTFVVGDAARVVDADGDSVPASAQAAVREARVAADNIARLVDHDLGADGGFTPRLDRFTFDSPGWVVSVGDTAVAQVGGSVLRGGAARAAKASIGAKYLTDVGAMERAVGLVREELGG